MKQMRKYLMSLEKSFEFLSKKFRFQKLIINKFENNSKKVLFFQKFIAKKYTKKINKK